MIRKRRSGDQLSTHVLLCSLSNSHRDHDHDLPRNPQPNDRGERERAQNDRGRRESGPSGETDQGTDEERRVSAKEEQGNPTRTLTCSSCLCSDE